MCCLQEQKSAKEKEDQEAAEATQAADDLCGSRLPSQTLPEDASGAAEASDAAAAAEAAPPSLLTGVGIDDVDGTHDSDVLGAENAAPPVLEEGADETDAASFEPEPYTAADIQVCGFCVRSASVVMQQSSIR